MRIGVFLKVHATQAVAIALLAIAHTGFAQAADVSAALRKYVDPAKVTVVKAGDFSKAK